MVRSILELRLSFLLRVIDLDLEIAGFASLSGNFGARFISSGSDESILISGSGITATMGEDPIALSVSDADFALLILGETYALHAQGTVSLIGVPSVTLSGIVEVQANTTGEQVVDFGDHGEIDFGTSAELYLFVGTDLLIGFDGSLSG